MTKYMSIEAFREEGYLQEVNRQFFHPLGLALDVTVESDGTMKLGGIWDYRDHPEGIVFEMRTDMLKARRIYNERVEKGRVRMREFAWATQPAGVLPRRRDP